MKSVLFSSVPGSHIPDVEERIYQQVHGTAMGSPVLVVVANLVMEDIECSALSSFHTPPHFWRRYVDDTSTVLVEPFHAHLNSIDLNIQFTVERESEGQLPLLDVLLTRDGDGGISTSLFHKATHMDQCTWPMNPITQQHIRRQSSGH